MHCSASASSAMARVFVNIPFAGSVFESFADKDLVNLNSNDVTKLDDMQITDHGITIAIKEVYYDQSNISIAYLVSGAAYSDEKHFNAVGKCCNGNPISGGGGASYNKISDKLYSGLDMFYPGVGSELPDQFNLQVVLTDDMEKSQESPFRFTIPVSRTHADEKTREMLVMNTGMSGNSMVLVKKIVFTPVSTLVEYEYTHPDDHGKQLQGKHEVKLIDAQGVNIDGGSLSWNVEKSKDQYTNTGRANFSASNQTKGNWTFELVPTQGDSIKVNFNI
ncbi:MAG TPA: DUF4179 domain-containing protein [Syntrophomonadaceae bacterium]|nr:DUF4179 domain-containing protein [Syntrophomonadaceae bacterium]